MISIAWFSTELRVFNSCGCREAGVVIKNVDLTSGEVTLNLNEELFLVKNSSSETFSHAANVVESNVESSTARKPQKKQTALFSVTKYASMIPEKVSWFKFSLHGLVCGSPLYF